jgi:hypothetical protein
VPDPLDAYYCGSNPCFKHKSEGDFLKMFHFMSIKSWSLECCFHLICFIIVISLG